ncbi:MAG: transposase [Oscillospiraceae bacterium]|nr:transposase [Oscillospiraceae bacterium]
MLNLSETLALYHRTAIMPIDNAKYHHFKGIDDWWSKNIHNITLMYIPSYCSDLNSIEHLWKDTRSNVTHNTLFENLGSLVSHVKDYISSLKLSPGKLANLCHFIY